MKRSCWRVFVTGVIYKRYFDYCKQGNIMTLSNSAWRKLSMYELFYKGSLLKQVFEALLF